MTLCTSENCPYVKQCGRQARDDVDEIEDTFYNFEYGGCDLDNGFSDYLKTE